MQIASYKQNKDIKIGAVIDGNVVDLSDITNDMLSFIHLGEIGLTKAREIIANSQQSVALANVHLLAPIPFPPRNIMCLGLNYAEHAQESYEARGHKTQLPEFPIIFTKATTSVNGPYDEIPYDVAVSSHIDWEVELGIIIGRRGKNIPVSDALSYVYGYIVVNDISARDLQREHKQFFKGKSLDGACPMGPWIVTADHLPDPHNLRITSRVNQVTKQDSNTRHMIFDIPTTIHHLSRGMTLIPGDIIATGTPSGVGFARRPPEFLGPGDVVECEVEGIGVIRNTISLSS